MISLSGIKSPYYSNVLGRYIENLALCVSFKPYLLRTLSLKGAAVARERSAGLRLLGGVERRAGAAERELREAEGKEAHMVGRVGQAHES